MRVDQALSGPLALMGVFAVGAVFFTAAFADTRAPVEERSGARVAAEPAGSDELLSAGERVFKTSCQACHGKEGTGGVGPRLDGGRTLERFPDQADQVAMVRHGTRAGERYGVGGRGTGGMPPWANMLTPAEIEAVVAYERSL